MKVTAAATLTLSASRDKVSTILALVTLSHIMKFESGAKRSITPPIITLNTAYVPGEQRQRYKHTSLAAQHYRNNLYCWTYMETH